MVMEDNNEVVGTNPEEVKSQIEGQLLLPKEAVSVFECKRCGCSVFQPCIRILTIDAVKAEQLGCPIPVNPHDSLNNGPYRFLQQDAGIFACAGCGRKYRSEEMMVDYIKATAPKEPTTVPVNNVTEPVANEVSGE